MRRLGAVPARVDAAAELAVGARRLRPRSGEVARALAEGQIIKTFAFRGATHLLTPEDGGAYLALRAASRMWGLPSWQSFGVPFLTARENLPLMASLAGIPKPQAR